MEPARPGPGNPNARRKDGVVADMRGLRWTKTLTIVAGAIYTATALVMLAAPMWFYETVGHFPPYNRHFIGDTATFTLPIGVALMWAARDLERHRALLALGLGASFLHAGNHVMDAVGEPPIHWLLDVGPLVLLTAVLAGVWLREKAQDGAD